MFAFKKFSFFQQVEVKLHGFPPNSTCHTVSPQHLFVGCDNGSIHVLDETYQSQGSFNGFAHKVLFVAYAKVSPGVSVGFDTSSSVPGHRTRVAVLLPDSMINHQ